MKILIRCLGCLQPGSEEDQRTKFTQPAKEQQLRWHFILLITWTIKIDEAGALGIVSRNMTVAPLAFSECYNRSDCLKKKSHKGWMKLEFCLLFHYLFPSMAIFPRPVSNARFQILFSLSLSPTCWCRSGGVTIQVTWSNLCSPSLSLSQVVEQRYDHVNFRNFFSNFPRRKVCYAFLQPWSPCNVHHHWTS